MSVDLKVGQHVSFLRMANKAVSLTGTIMEVCADGKSVVVKLDANPDILEGAHVDDVTVLDEKDAAELRGDGIDATATSKGVEVNIP